MMSKLVLILVGILLLFLLILLLIARTPNIRALISKMPRSVVLILMLILLVALGFVAAKLLLPRGENSLFSQSAVGEIIGAEEETQNEATPEKSSEAGSDADTETDGDADTDTESNKNPSFSLEQALNGNASGDSRVYVTVREKTVSIGTTVFADQRDLKDALLSLKEQKAAIVLVDEYAYAEAYKEVRQLLQELEISYEEMQK